VVYAKRPFAGPENDGLTRKALLVGRHLIILNNRRYQDNLKSVLFNDFFGIFWLNGYA